MPCTDRRARSLLQRLLAPERPSASQVKLLSPKLVNYVWADSARLHRGDHHGSTAYTRRRGKPSTGPSWVLTAWIADRLTNSALVAASEIECSQPCMAAWCNARCSPWRVVASARHAATHSTKNAGCDSRRHAVAAHIGGVIVRVGRLLHCLSAITHTACRAMSSLCLHRERTARTYQPVTVYTCIQLKGVRMLT